MSRFFYIAALLITALVGQTSATAQGHDKQDNPQGNNQPVASSSSDQTVQEGEKVYTTRDVTQKAVIKSRPAPDYPGDPREWGYLTVVLRVVLRASGVVDNIKVTKISPGNLSSEKVQELTRICVKAAGKIKFKPALKDGQPVSQYLLIEYHFGY